MNVVYACMHACHVCHVCMYDVCMNMCVCVLHHQTWKFARVTAHPPTLGYAFRVKTERNEKKKQTLRLQTPRFLCEIADKMSSHPIPSCLNPQIGSSFHTKQPLKSAFKNFLL